MEKYLEATEIIDYNNKEGVDAQFNPPYEQLAFKLGENEFDLFEVLSEPLKSYKGYDEMIENFPDVEEQE